MPEFNRFDVVEAHACYAHDYGDYTRFARCEKICNLRPNLKTETLSENAKEIYAVLADKAEKRTGSAQRFHL